MQTKAAIEIYQYWDSARGRRRVPSRSQIEPGKIRHILPDLFILEKTAAGEIRFRLAGTRICALFARELRGSRFDALWAAQETTDLNRLAEDVMAQCGPIRLTADASTGRPQRLPVEMVLLPLRSTNGNVDRIIGSLVPQTRPIWLDVSPVNFLTLETAEPIDNGDLLPAMRDQQRPPALAPIADETFGQTIRRVLHLRVLEGGKHN